MEALIIERNVPIPPRSMKPEGSCSHCSRMPRPGLKTCDVRLAQVARAVKSRKEQGLCTWGGSCPNRPTKPHVICSDHRRRLVIDNKARRDRRKAAKLCIACGIRPQWWTVWCITCRALSHKGIDPLPSAARKALHRYRRKEKINARREQAKLAVEWTVNERTVKILTMRHGLEDGVDRTLEEIGATFDVTRERIRQIEAAQLKWLEGEGFDVSLLWSPFEETERKPQATRRHLTSDEQRKKARCHSLVAEALKSGDLIKGLCQVCEAVDVVGHHQDYDKPLEIEWLCRKHHAAAHRAMSANRAVN